jgi:hypothetical protein
MFETEEQDDLIEQEPETELEQEEEEIVDESDEESSDESEYGEEDAEVSQDQDPDTEEVDEDFRVLIPVSRDDGDIEEVELSAEQLSDIVAKSRDFDKLNKKVRDAEATVNQSRQLVEFVSTHPVVSRVTWLYANGYNDEQVISHLQEILNMSQNNNQQYSDPNFDMLDDYQKAAFMSMKQQFEQERQARLELEQRIQKVDSERTLESVGQHNSRTFDNAINSLNLDFTGTENDLRKIRAAAEALYPNVNLATWKFSKDQAEAILTRAGLQKRTSKSGSKIKQVNKSKTAPRVLGGTKTPGNNRRQAPPQKSGPLSMEDRRKSLLSMGLG